MNGNSNGRSLFRQPAAWVPLVISFAALAFLLGYVAVFGISRNANADEGAPARIFQLLMAVQLPVIAWFAFKWLPKRPKETMLILALQGIAWGIPIATVLWLESL